MRGGLRSRYLRWQRLDLYQWAMVSTVVCLVGAELHTASDEVPKNRLDALRE
jgi:hypothetical protein